ncbi:MAG: hypothetical protein ACHQIL_10900 [Steroidobacterales bacterium]
MMQNVASTIAHIAGLLLLAIAAQAARADDACIEFAWDVRAEHLIFAMQPKALAAGSDRAGAPAVGLDRLYQLHLAKQADVQFATPPGAREMRPDSYAGLVQLQVAVPGAYRIAADQPLWIDVAFNGALLKPQDFQGRRGCTSPHKIVEFVLPMGVQLTVQISNAANADVRLSITPSQDGSH